MKDRFSMLHALANGLDLPDETIPGQPLVEISGNRRVVVEHHQGVSEYSTCRICIRVKGGGVLICGDNLQLSKMTTEQLIVCGCIRAVELLRGKC